MTITTTHAFIGVIGLVLLSGCATTSTELERRSASSLPTFIDPATALGPRKDLGSNSGDSWYVIANVNGGGHQLGFLVHYLNTNTGLGISSVSITDQTTGWYAKGEERVLGGKASATGDGMAIHTPNVTWTGDSKQMQLHAKLAEGEVDATLRSQGPVLAYMGTGYFPLFDNGFPNYEFAFPRMSAFGTLTIAGKTYPIEGQAWFDRQWGPLPMSEMGQGAKWSWMAMHLSNGDEMALWDTVRRHEQAWVTVLRRDGTHLIARAEPVPSEFWTSSDTGNRYPTRWTVTIPNLNAKLDVSSNPHNQELSVPPVTRYEGTIDVVGHYGGQPVTGSGYMELSGWR